jgi:hypothetical protein
MPSLVFDFADIHKRMLGDLKKRKELSAICNQCNGTGLRHSSILQKYVLCEACDPSEEPF